MLRLQKWKLNKLCGLEGTKALGPDGFTFAFLKTHWECIKEDIVSFVKEFELSGCILKGSNSTFITLIPKKGDPLVLSDYRPQFGWGAVQDNC